MADAALYSTGPLDRIAASGRHGRTGGEPGVRIRILRDVAALSVMARRGGEAATLAALGRAVGAPVEDRSARWSAGGLSVQGTGPGQWLVMARPGDAPGRLDALRGALTGHASLVDQGDGRTVLEVAGSDARRALAKGIQIDLHPEAFRVGNAAACSASHIGLQIALLDAVPTFEIITAVSTAGSFWSWLSSAAAEYGLEVLT